MTKSYGDADNQPLGIFINSEFYSAPLAWLQLLTVACVLTPPTCANLQSSAVFEHEDLAFGWHWLANSSFSESSCLKSWPCCLVSQHSLPFVFLHQHIFKRVSVLEQDAFPFGASHDRFLLRWFKISNLIQMRAHLCMQGRSFPKAWNSKDTLAQRC